MTDTTVVTIVAYELKGEDYTAELVAKQGLFWLVRDQETGVEKKIPAKAVTETWEESDEQDPAEFDPNHEPEAYVSDAEPVDPPAMDNEASHDDEPATSPVPSLADQAAAGPVIAEPGDTITLKQLCEDQGIEGRIARRQLRAAVAKDSAAIDSCLATEGHEAGGSWVFKRSAIADVMKIITTRQRG